MAGTLLLVAGALANKPNHGGEAWVRLSWVEGLRRLGYEVWFLEQLEAAACADEQGIQCPFDRAVGRTYFRQIVEDFGLSARAVLVDGATGQIDGATEGELRQLAGRAAALFNISGHLRIPWLCERVRRRVYIDIDPGFTQFWHVQTPAAGILAGHDDYFTIGVNIGTSRCSIPTVGLHWRTTLQPVVLADWPQAPVSGNRRWTTVANWRGPYGPVIHGGRTLGLKVHEFRKVLPLPRQVPQAFEIALNIHPADEADRCHLVDHGWRLVDPREVALSPQSFRRYIQGSGGEFSVAQGMYVDTHSGWFSDRSTRYLASGKPVLLQDTGLANHLPVGRGLVVFRTLDEAAAGALRIAEDYEGHASAARRLAETHFDSDIVLGRLVEQLDLPR